MTQTKLFSKLRSLWRSYNAMLLLIIFLIIFFSYSIFLAINLKNNIIPDEPYRFEISQHFAGTWQIPENNPASISYGDDLSRNPFLGHWIFGRALNAYQIFAPNTNFRQQLVFLRVINSLFSLGSLIFTYFLSKEIINNKWWQLLPVFILSNTLMFVFLSAGVSYDNPTNMFCAAGLFFLVRVLNKKDFFSNSLCWLISISIASLIKHTVAPLALAMLIVWLIYVFINRQTIRIENFKNVKNAILIGILLILIFLNIYLYGINLIKFQSLTPVCTDTFPADICDVSVYVVRHQQLSLPEKLTLTEVIKRGYPDPVRYLFDNWIREMTKRTFGIMGHLDYFPIAISYFLIAFYWMTLLSFRYIRKVTFLTGTLASIFLFYALVLFIMNYNSELSYGFYKYVALQGRYIFPVIAIAFNLYAFVLSKVTNKIIQTFTIIATIILFLYGGPIRFIWYYNSVFADWFI